MTRPPRQHLRVDLAPPKTVPTVVMRGEGGDIFIIVDGLKIARRGYPNTPQARTWVSLEPGWEVRGLEQIEIWHDGWPL
jgi:hypothetical protein